VFSDDVGSPMNLIEALDPAAWLIVEAAHQGGERAARHRN